MCHELEEAAKKVVEEEFQIDEEYMRMLQNQNLENSEVKDANAKRDEETKTVLSGKSKKT